ncbi:MAG: hypothetical protein ACXWQO_02375 [Bdellovibrionota bacterium]
MKNIAKLTLLVSAFTLISATSARADTFNDVSAAAAGAALGCAGGAVPGAMAGAIPAVAFSKNEKQKAIIFLGSVAAGCAGGAVALGDYAYEEQQKADAAVQTELQQRDEAPEPRDP